MKQLLNQLLEWVEFAGYFIVICKSNDLGNKNLPILFNLKLLGSKWLGTVINSAGSFLGFDRFDSLAVAEEIILVPERPVLFDERLNDKEVNYE